MKRLANVHPGEVLQEEFLIPLEITAYRLSKDLNIPQTRISEIIKGNRRITADTALRLFLLIFISCKSQNCDCEGFIDLESDKIISIYSDSNGKTKIAELQNDLENEDFLIFKILESDKNYFKVEIGRAMNEHRITGWVKKIKEIAIYDRNYSDSETLNLYTEPKKESKIKTKISEYNTDYYTIKDCKGKWIYAYREKEGEIYEGWLEPTMQCSSPYTTCN